MRMPMIAGWTLLFAIAGCSGSGASAASTTPAAAAVRAGSWTANGATACKKLLTPDFLGALLPQPAGDSGPNQDATSCTFGTDGGLILSIFLSDHVTLGDWEGYNHRLRPGAIAVAGVGDKAVSDDNFNIVDSWKTGDRTCALRLIPLGQDPKLTGDALARKLGSLCNQLFALP